MSHQVRRFIAAVGVQSAQRLQQAPPFIRRGRPTGRFAVGIRYEREVHEYLALLALGRPDLEYVPSPWFQYQDKSGRRWCQPDALIFKPESRVGIVYEAKYQHIADAWWQLTQLYVPVLQRAYPLITTWGMVEICHWHDPSVTFPEKYELTSDPLTVRNSARVSVHIYNPKRKARSLEAGLGSGSSGGQAADRGRSA